MKILIIATFVLAIASIFKPEIIKSFIDWIRVIVLSLWNWNYLVVFISSIIESFPVLWVVIPGQNIMLISGWFFGEQWTDKLIYIILLACFGAMIGNYSGYLLGKCYGKDFFRQYGLWFWIWETEVRYLEKWIKTWGPWGVILAKFHNLARAFIPFIAGSTGMRHLSFFIYNAIGSIIYSVVIILLWVVFATYYEVALDYIGYIFMGIMVLVGLYIWKFKKAQFIQYMNEKNAEIESKMQKR